MSKELTLASLATLTGVGVIALLFASSAADKARTDMYMAVAHSTSSAAN